MNNQETPTVSKPPGSIAVEWENALNAEASRAVSMLREVKKQVNEPAATSCWGPFELLIVYDDIEFATREVAKFIADAIGQDDPNLSWRLIAATRGGYYKSKDAVAKHALGEIVVFFDSDAIPENDCLKPLLDVFKDENVQIAVGNTYIYPQDLLGTTFALTWFFPVRVADDPVRPVHQIHVSNFAARFEFHLDHPFPEIEGTSRGSCIVLARQLAQSNIVVHQIPNARASHPAPNGAMHFATRALAQGCDRVLRERLIGSTWSRLWLAACSRLPRHLAGCAWRVCFNFRRVELNLLMVPAAIAISWSYFFLYWAGETGLHLGLKPLLKIRV